MATIKEKAHLDERLTDALESLAQAILERNRLREVAAAPGAKPAQLIALSHAERAAIAAEAAVKEAENVLASLRRLTDRG